ncbi:MFS transporter [Streptomyces gamaensis]|uniref:MFS transporter n=2 Tax=Streptomyces gamaensis TaxID=1763542 RepID=A0ABW0YVL0_9ACTN
MTPLLLGSVLNPVNTTAIATGLVAIGQDFGTGPSGTAWLVSVLYLTSAVGQPAMGRLADTLGARRVFLAGLVLVCGAGLLGTLAPGFGWLLASRALLGVGTSAAYPAAMALLRAEARRVGREAPRAVMGRLSLAALGSAAVGPALGGLLTATTGWRGIFAVNIPLAAVAFALAVRWLPREHRTAAPAAGTRRRAADADADAGTPGREACAPAGAGSSVPGARPPSCGRASAGRAGRGALRRLGGALPSAPAGPLRGRDRTDASGIRAAGPRDPSPDPLGMLLFAAVLAAAMVFLLDLAHPRWLLLPVVALLGAALAVCELRHARPFVDLRMLTHNRALAFTYLRHGLAYLAIYCTLYGFTQWLEVAHGYDALGSGLIMLPMSAAAAACSLLGARTKGLRAPLTAVAALLVAGSGALLLTDGATPVAVLLVAAALFGIPQGLASTGNQAAVYAQAPPDGVGAAAGLQRAAQYLGAITATGLLGLCYGQRPTDGGLHRLAAVTGAVSLLLLALTVTDRALRARTRT